MFRRFSIVCPKTLTGHIRRKHLKRAEQVQSPCKVGSTWNHLTRPDSPQLRRSMIAQAAN